MLLQQQQMVIIPNLGSGPPTLKTLEIRAHNIFVQDDDNSIILVGDKGSGLNRALRVYTMPASGNSQSMKPEEVAQTEIWSYERSTDSIALTGINENGERAILIATLKGSFVQVFLPREG